MHLVTSGSRHDLHYERHDFTDPWRDAPAVILQHGFGRSGRMWFSVVPYLARNYRIICPDLRGLGGSSGGFDPADVTREGLVDDLVRIADQERLETFHFAGESLGGTLGLALAADHPDRVRTLGLVGAPVWITDWMKAAYAVGHQSWPDAIEKLGPEGWAKASNAAARFPAEIGSTFLDWYSGEIGRARPEILVAYARFASAVDMRPDLQRVSAPVLGIYPSGGRVASDDQIDALKAALGRFLLVRPDGSHQMIHMLQPAACARLLLQFMALHDGTVCRD